MIINLLTPRLGEGVEQVTVVNWLKKEGDTVKEYEPLVEVETDKVITEIPSPADGVLVRILIQPNAEAKVGQALAEIAAGGEETQPAQPRPQSQISTPGAPILQQAVPQAEHFTPSSRSWVSPVVAKMIKELNLDLRAIKGTGSGGRVTKQDVLDHLEASRTRSDHVQLETGQPPPSPVSGLQAVNPIRRRIAERMVHSIHTAPHVLTVMEADLSRVLSHLEKNQAQFAAEGIRLTLTAYFIQALARSLRENPMVNSSWKEEGIQVHPQVNIGMAVSLGDEGLIVPVIRNADSLSLIGIARAVNDLAGRARTGKLQPDEVRGATFSLTNHGTGGSLFATPIINQPQSGILGTGTMQKRPVVVTDELGRESIAIRPMIYLSFVFDHRVLDGSSADKFLKAIKGYLEIPQE